LAKTFSISERLRAGFRVEMFNVFNRVRFGQGSLTIQSQAFGILNQTAGRSDQHAAADAVRAEGVFLNRSRS